MSDLILKHSQEVLSTRLMNDIRAAISKPEYDHMYISTLIGVLEMVKLENYERMRRESDGTVK